MITNAKLVSIAPPPIPNADGGRVVQPPVIATDEVFVDEPRQSQLVALANKVADVSAVLYAPSFLNDVLVTGARVTYRLDGRAERTMQVAHAIDRNKLDGPSHVEAYLKRV